MTSLILKCTSKSAYRTCDMNRDRPCEVSLSPAVDGHGIGNMLEGWCPFYMKECRKVIWEVTYVS